MRAIYSVDVGVVLDGFNGDSARTYGVGTISPNRAAYWSRREALNRAVAAAASAIGRAQSACGGGLCAAARSWDVREYAGTDWPAMHEDPHVPNVGSPRGRDPAHRVDTGYRAHADERQRGHEDDARWVDRQDEDGSLSTHFEHTVADDAEGGQVLTRRLVPVLE
jgi:methionyl aminopeptidase